VTGLKDVPKERGNIEDMGGENLGCPRSFMKSHRLAQLIPTPTHLERDALKAMVCNKTQGLPQRQGSIPKER